MANYVAAIKFIHSFNSILLGIRVSIKEKEFAKCLGLLIGDDHHKENSAFAILELFCYMGFFKLFLLLC